MEFAKKIHIWHIQVNPCGKNLNIPFMYKPIIRSLINIIKELYNSIEIDYKINNNHDFSSIQPGDVLIWVGCANNILISIGCKNVPNFLDLKNKGIYTIYYNTEPYTENSNPNEVWTYSMDIYNKYVNNTNKIIKFIPITCEENLPVVPYNIMNSNIKLIFIGLLQFRQNKYKQLSDTLKQNVSIISNIWNDEEFNQLISKNANFYLSWNKEGTYALPSVRINKLLSHKCIIISEHTNPDDEELYKDIIYFCNLQDIEGLYNDLIKKSQMELQEISDRHYKIFHERFNSKNAIQLIQTKSSE